MTVRIELGNIINETGKTNQALFMFLPNVFLGLGIFFFDDFSLVWGGNFFLMVNTHILQYVNDLHIFGGDCFLPLDGCTVHTEGKIAVQGIGFFFSWKDENNCTKP